jgi:hypothetical protein
MSDEKKRARIITIPAMKEGGRVAGKRERSLAPDEAVTLDDFYAYMPMHNYIFVPTRDTWPASSVNARIPRVSVGQTSDDKEQTIAASTWLDQNKPVEQMTWAPGEPLLVRDRLIAEGGWIDRIGVRCFNLYRAPLIKPGDPEKAEPWLDHVFHIYGRKGGRYIIRWLAHRVQRPQDKINHALFLGGAQGIGKDTLLEPVRWAIGPWNFAEVSPKHVTGRFNKFLKSVILRVNEARDLGDVDRFKFYDHMKAYTATPPDVLLIDEKHLKEYYIPNVCGVIITSNHRTDGIYLPPDDRRHYVAWSQLTKEDFTPKYWNQLWGWYHAGGFEHVAAYLLELDLSEFDPKAPPPKTRAFWDIVDANRAPEDSELADVLDNLRNPDAVLVTQIRHTARSMCRDDLSHWLSDRKNRRAIPHRLETQGYVQVRNDTAHDGVWKIRGQRHAIYAKATLTPRERLVAARELCAHAMPIDLDP